MTDDSAELQTGATCGLCGGQIVPDYPARPDTYVHRDTGDEDCKPATAATEIRELARLTQPDRLIEGKHACPVGGCGLSAEEHHALGQGTRDLMIRIRELENVQPNRSTAAKVTEFAEMVVEMLDEHEIAIGCEHTTAEIAHAIAVEADDFFRRAPNA